jgi:uncharacterized protein
MNGYNIAVDGNSGSVHMLDEISCRVLREMSQSKTLSEIQVGLEDEYPAADVAEACGEIRVLAEQGLLFASDQSITEAAGAAKNAGSLKALCLNVSHDCNLMCEYCFASKGDYQGGRQLMPAAVALRAVDYLVEHSGSRRNIEIDFFGGEPLMNFDVVRKAVAYGREIGKQAGKDFYFTITTNGTLLDRENTAFINVEMDNVVISIDGRKEVHDAIRCDRTGRGSYDRIVPLAQELVKARKNKSYFIRGTFTSRNKDFSRDVMHLADLGFKEISVEPVVGKGDKIFISEADVPEILAEYEKFALEYLDCLCGGKGFRFYNFDVNLYKGPCVYKRLAACGAGSEYLAVAPDGKLYPCHQFVGLEDFIMGDLYGGVKNTEIRDIFLNSNILIKKKCRDCWAKLYCSGGCHANAWFSNGDITLPNEVACTLQKKRIECAIMIQAARLEHKGQ